MNVKELYNGRKKMTEAGVIGQSRVMAFDPVSNWYNVPFDAAMWLVLYLFIRGALEGIEASHIHHVGPLLTLFKTSQDLANNRQANIPIKSNRRNEPLYVATTLCICISLI
jgi:hypothetical protein